MYKQENVTENVEIYKLTFSGYEINLIARCPSLFLTDLKYINSCCVLSV